MKKKNILNLKIQLCYQSETLKEEIEYFITSTHTASYFTDFKNPALTLDSCGNFRASMKWFAEKASCAHYFSYPIKVTPKLYKNYEVRKIKKPFAS